MKIFNRQTLLEFYDEILARGLSPSQREEFRKSGNFGPKIIVQSSSGTSGRDILRIPRTIADIADVFQRTLVPYLSVFPEPPTRIAMIGGISHTEAALKMDLGGIRFCSFSLQQLEDLQTFDPEVISCYPNIARELYRNPDLSLPSLKTFKLGGEPVLDIDLDLLKKRFGQIAICEQVGSTEMPALAIGLREPGQKRRLTLQTKRFTFMKGDAEQWRPLVAKDCFSDLLFPIREFYDTGDEALYDGEYLYEVRRAGSVEFSYLPLLEQIISLGATNAQIDFSSEKIFVAGNSNAMPKKIVFRDKSYHVETGTLERTRHSNKLKFIR